MFGYSRIAVKRALTASMAATTMVIGVTPSGLGAQDQPPVPIVGDRVRVALPDATVIGEVTGVSPEGFDIDIEGDGYRSVIHSEIEQLELSLETKNYAAEGLMIGLGGGAVAGWLIGRLGFAVSCAGGAVLSFGIVLADDDYCSEEDQSRSGLVGAVSGAALLGLIGLIKGRSTKRDSWETISHRDTGGTLSPVIDVRLGREERPATVVPPPGNEVVVDLPDAPRFGSGERVRVSVDGNRIIGQATAVNDEGFELVQGDMRRSFAYRDIDGLERSIGMRSRWKTGLGIGLLGGMVAFPTFKGAWGCVVDDWKGPSCKGKGKDLLAWIGTGTLLGLGVGALINRESWAPIALFDEMVSISPIVAPQRGLEGRHGLMLGARIEF